MRRRRWRAILPELVSKDDLAAASALNGIEFNLARAVGPALAGLVIASGGRRRGIRGECVVVLRSDPGGCAMEEARPQADCAAGDAGGSHSRRAPLRPLLASGHARMLVRVGVVMLFA